MDILDSMTPEQMRVAARLVLDNVRGAIKAIEDGRRGDALKLLKAIVPREPAEYHDHTPTGRSA